MSEERMNAVAEVVRSVMPDKSLPLSESASLVDELGFDSVSFLELITALEVRFGLTFADEDLQIDRFQTARAIAETIGKYQG